MTNKKKYKYYYGNCLDCDKKLTAKSAKKCRSCIKKGVPSKQLGLKRSEETRQKLSIAKSLNPSRYWKGKKRPELSELMKGKKLTEEHKSSLKKAWTKRIDRGELSPNWKGGYDRKLWHNRNRYIKKLSNGGEHTFEEWEKMKEEYKFTCLCCFRKEPEIKLSVDHILPLSKGGRNDIINVQPLCRSCNSRKYNKTINYKNP